jgi:hypothetical protein
MNFRKEPARSSEDERLSSIVIIAIKTYLLLFHKEEVIDHITGAIPRKYLSAKFHALSIGYPKSF